MRSNTTAVIMIAAVAICLVSTATSFIYHERVLDHLRGVERDLEQEENKMLSTTWMSGGEEVTCTTPQNADESIDDWAERHKARVAALKVHFPVDPGSDDPVPLTTDGK